MAAPWHASAAPGGPWVLRSASSPSLATAGKVVAQPRENEAAAVAWKARRKPTIHGQLGTGNRISSVVQYPVTSKDPHNLCRGFRNHLSAEDRRILRVRVKHHMKGCPNYPECMYMVEKMLLKQFAASSELCNTFYCNDDFAKQILNQAATSVNTLGAVGALKGGRPRTPQGEPAGVWEESYVEKSKFAAARFVEAVAVAAPLLAQSCAANRTT
mmetsp:Transcript_29297/g.58478  ORF Transcript_29297/g.58478 Transcript_29297/m.58478 type:complete len:214 (-) Transcript_29297:70-711(-)